jgi:orotidine-5'-phosphate decarboxylase
MTFLEKHTQRLQQTNTQLCVGIDPDITKIPEYYHSQNNPVLGFAKDVIDATSHIATSYKLNFAFFEQYGKLGYEALEETVAYIPEGIITIADAKRGDIGNTSKAYAEAVFTHLNFDAITVSPYMGRDSVEPFLAYEDKCVFVLALTSNQGSNDFQRTISHDQFFYEMVITRCMDYSKKGTLGFVIGATHPAELAMIRGNVPDVPFLIPGIGAQGADATEVVQANGSGRAFFNISRAILYPPIPYPSYIDAVKMKAEEYATLLPII